MSEVESKILEIRNLVSKAERPLMFFDTDTDGGTSFLQIKNLNKNLVGFPISKAEKSQQGALDLVDFEPDLILFFDTPYICDFMFERFSKNKFVWIDHHPGNDLKVLEKYNISRLNPLDYNENDSRPSCYWAFRISGKKENLPLVSLGSVTDFYVLDVLRELYEFDKKYFKLIFNLSDEKRKELFLYLEKAKYDDPTFYKERISWVHYLIFETPLSIFRLFYDFVYKQDYDETLKTLKVIEKLSLFDLLAEINAQKGFPFEEFAKYLEKLNKMLKEFYKKNVGKEFVFLEHKGDVSYNRQLADELLYKLKDSKILMSIFRKDGSDIVSGSIRGKPGYVINDVIMKSCSGLDARGGGHPNGGGFSVSEKDFNEFQRRMEKFSLEKINN